MMEDWVAYSKLVGTFIKNTKRKEILKYSVVLACILLSYGYCKSFL